MTASAATGAFVMDRWSQRCVSRAWPVARIGQLVSAAGSSKPVDQSMSSTIDVSALVHGFGRRRPEADVGLHRGLQADVAAGHLRQDPLLLEHVAVGLQRIAQRTDRRHQRGEGWFEHVMEPPLRRLLVGQPAVLVILDPAAVLLEVVQQEPRLALEGNEAGQPLQLAGVEAAICHGDPQPHRAIAAGGGLELDLVDGEARDRSAPGPWPGSPGDRPVRAPVRS